MPPNMTPHPPTEHLGPANGHLTFGGSGGGGGGKSGGKGHLSPGPQRPGGPLTPTPQQQHLLSEPPPWLEEAEAIMNGSRQQQQQPPVTPEAETFIPPPPPPPPPPQPPNGGPQLSPQIVVVPSGMTEVSSTASDGDGNGNGPSNGNSGPNGPNNNSKKSSSRRNAWGNMSYADLITQAINSAPEKRLTLSQVYEWMVHNIPYFKDKGDSNSSAGWKVSKSGAEKTQRVVIL